VESSDTIDNVIVLPVSVFAKIGVVQDT